MAKKETIKKTVKKVGEKTEERKIEKKKVNPALDRGALDPAARTSTTSSVTLRQNRRAFKSGVKEKVKKEKKELPPIPQQPPAEAKLPKPAAPVPGEPRPAGRERYFEAVGRRKTSVARVRLFTRAGDFLVNEKPYADYFPTTELQKIVEDSLQKMKLFGRFKVTVKVSGGGVHSQAEALRHGLARCLVKFNPDFRKRLKRAGFLKRDPRMKERKKPGLKRARRAPQWRKR